MLAFTDMVHAAVADEAGVVTGGVIETWLTPAALVAGTLHFDVLAPRLANSLRRLVGALGPPMLAAQRRDAALPQQGGGGAGAGAAPAAPAAGGGAAGLWPRPLDERAGEDELPVFENFDQGERPANVIPGLNVGPADAAVRAGQEEAARIAAGGPPNVNGPQPSGITTIINILSLR